VSKRTWKVPLTARDERTWDPKIGDYYTVTSGSLAHYATEWSREIEWVDAPYEFEAELVVSALHRGRSSAIVTMIDRINGREYPMSIAELVKHVMSGRCRTGGIIEGRFTVVKRGQNYLIEVA
jgi:hypothetical protein